MKKMIPWEGGVKAYIVSSDFGDSIRITGGAPWVAYSITGSTVNLYSMNRLERQVTLSWSVAEETAIVSEIGSTRAYQGSYAVFGRTESEVLVEIAFVYPDMSSQTFTVSDFTPNPSPVVATASACYVVGINGAASELILVDSVNGQGSGNTFPVSVTGAMSPSAISDRVLVVCLDAFSSDSYYFDSYAGGFSSGVADLNATEDVGGVNEDTAYMSYDDGTTTKTRYVGASSGTFDWGVSFLPTEFTTSDDYWTQLASLTGRTMPAYPDDETSVIGSIGGIYIFTQGASTNLYSQNGNVALTYGSLTNPYFAASQTRAFYAYRDAIDSTLDIHNSDTLTPVTVTGVTAHKGAVGLRSGARFLTTYSGGIKMVDGAGDVVYDATGTITGTAYPVMEETRSGFIFDNYSLVEGTKVDFSVAPTVVPLEEWTRFKYLRLWNA